MGEGRRLRWAPANARAPRLLEDDLAQVQDDNRALFLNRSGTRFSVRGIALLVNRYLRAAGITDRSGPHVLRHTFATHALRARPNTRAVQELLGHAWVTITQRPGEFGRPSAASRVPGQRGPSPGLLGCTSRS